MITPIADLPEFVLGFRASGTVTAADYETVIIPAVESLFARRDKLRLVYHLGRDFAGFEAGAMWDDAKVGLGHLGGWERIAVVTDVGWIRAAVKLFALAIPGSVRVFPDLELDKALEWVRA